jgi:malonate transporter
MYSVFCNVLPIFLIAFIGVLVKRKWLVSDEFWRGLEKLSFYLLFPAVLFSSVYKLDLASVEFFRLVAALIVSNLLISGLVIYYQMRQNYSNIHFTSLFQGATRYNNYIFFALGAALFGEAGLSVVSAISPYMIVLTNITAVMCFVHYVPQESGGASKKRSLFLMLQSIITNPFVIASLVGFIFNYFHITLNKGLENTIDNLADAALTIGILIVGASLRFKISPEHMRLITAASFIKLIITPVITFVILWIMAISGVAKSVGILFSCLPCASSAYILSRQLGGDPETMSSIITFTTLFSVLSLSILVYILG